MSASDGETVNDNQVATELFAQIQQALGVNYHWEVPEKHCEKYNINLWELDRLKRVSQLQFRKTERSFDEDLFQRIKERIKRTHFQQFIGEHFKDATQDEQYYLMGQISREYDAGSDYGQDESEHPLRELLNLGLPGIRKLRSKEARKTRVKSTRVVWTIIKGLLQLAIVLSIYGQLQDSYQAIIVSILLTIYSLVALHASYSAARYFSNIIQADIHIRELREALGKPLDAASRSSMEKRAKDLKGQETAVLIYQFTLGMLNLIALWKIIRAIGWF